MGMGKEEVAPGGCDSFFFLIHFYFLLLFGVFCCVGRFDVSWEPCLICVGACVCVRLGHPPFRGEERTPNTWGTLPNRGRNSNQKVKARKMHLVVWLFLCSIFNFILSGCNCPSCNPSSTWAVVCTLIFIEPFLQNATLSC